MPFIAVIGAGVVGLSTAIKIQEEGHQVIIIAESFPGDVKSIRYTSPWAGAHHVSLALDDERQRKMDRETFDLMWKMSEGEAEGCFMRLPQTEFYEEEQVRETGLNVMPDFRLLEPSELIPGSKSGVTFRTITIDTAVYLPYLLSLVLSKGGRIHRTSLQHISQVIEGAFSQPPDAVVVCAGIGARWLGGVEDKDMYPIRGQTVLLRAPWIQFGRTLSSLDGEWTYIIPRRSGEVIIGGTKHANDWYPHPRPEITADILRRCLKLCPELAPPHVREGGKQPTTADLESIIIELGCGLRPGRKGGIRLEATSFENGKQGKIPVVFNYGHGGAGYQSSWGSASLAVALLKESLTGNVEGSSK